MITLVLALLAAQPAEPPVRMDDRPAPWPDPEREKDGAVSKSDPQARLTMARFAACVADGSAGKVADVLTRDFRTTEYRNGLKNLARANDGCARRVGLRDTLRMSNLPFAAALAEVMIGRNPAPLKNRLARAASGKEVATFAPSDKIAMCVTRSTPDDVAALFATAPDSADEAKAAAALQRAVELCGQGVRLDNDIVGLRSILATATYRLLAAQES